MRARRVPPPDGAHPALVTRGDHLDPDMDDLVAQLSAAVTDAAWRARAGPAAAAWVLDNKLTWQDVADAHLKALGVDV